MLSTLKLGSVALLVVAPGIQLLPSPIERVRHGAPSARFEEAMSPEVGAIIQRSCKDCHSNETRWPWYSHVAPVSWIVARDVKRGREKLNFSDWTAQKRSPNEVEEICDAVTNGSMPLRGYRLMHRESTLSTQDVDVICAWADATMAQARVPAPTAEAADLLDGGVNDIQQAR